ncbi:transcriptional regulator [Streptomyces sp. CHA1]|uniref:transcriptional regulator n=2 Tax=Streptomyces TaxID=1883 RepID=UPI001BFCAD7B|nr:MULTISPECIES: transcriptional regulator [unclassified Streptomyces]MBT3161451.1 transcriptional regulator [Streptomyces sp. G11C]MCO6704281.1 transcriptional regulator [Streptomyces sp. CHB9.2]MCO6710550.1 transcriptional regulator [Streptomyces sp. CHA3]MCO6716350.1 transcriptional regulator [Streptomyces sp. CHB19.2]MCO6722481.1 transcriptional regulator [Streptomyces sp. Vc714c-19]
MLALPSDIRACPETEQRRHLAVQLSEMIPGAATVRVSFNDPNQTWPHLHAAVKDGAGKPLEVGRTTSRVAARWILRVWPEADWRSPHIFDLAEATLTRTDQVAAGRDR